MNISYNEYNRRLGFALELAAQAWCKEKTQNKVMDVDLANEFAKILVKEMYEPRLGCATTGEIIEELKARSDLEYSTILGGGI